MSPVKALRGARGHRTAIFAWAGTIAVALLLAGYLLTVAIGNNRGRVDSSCDGLHKIVVVGGDIIDDGFGDLANYRDEGTITQAQYERGVEQTRARLERWRSADCR